MRAGELDREIVIQRVTSTPDDFGVPVETWATLVTLRAKKIEGITADVTHSGLAVTDTTLSFQTYYFDGLTLEDRVSYEGQIYTLKSAKEIGRRRGLELSVERLGE